MKMGLESTEGSETANDATTDTSLEPRQGTLDALRERSRPRARTIPRKPWKRRLQTKKEEQM